VHLRGAPIYFITLPSVGGATTQPVTTITNAINGITIAVIRITYVVIGITIAVIRITYAVIGITSAVVVKSLRACRELT
jgi:hypothetical protein